ITELHDPEPVDVLCGGFPCQDLSYAGAGAGLAGARSGLWSEYARLIGELRPRYVLVENVSALLARGLGTVLGDLAALGFDAEWDCIPASAVGAPHRRDRIWLVAYPNADGRGLEVGGERDGGQDRPELEASQRDDAHRFREDMADSGRGSGEPERTRSTRGRRAGNGRRRRGRTATASGCRSRWRCECGRRPAPRIRTVRAGMVKAGWTYGRRWRSRSRVVGS
ncbi:MAG: DNA cytosine methyltransferase, partial [Gemmatimonadetes bacterium]|nr:DNA cytosine methyltransferase [Gemmatimonadota bacterium]